MSKYIKVNGRLYKAVVAKGDFLRDTRMLKQVAEELKNAGFATWWQGLGEEEDYIDLTASEKAKIKDLVSKMQAGQSKIKQAAKLVESAVGDYAKLESGYAQFRRYFE